MFEKEIARGMSLLDEKRPNWRERINIAELAPYYGPLEQIFGSYDWGEWALWPEEDHIEWFRKTIERGELAIAHGFNAYLVQTLTQEWKTILRLEGRCKTTK